MTSATLSPDERSRAGAAARTDARAIEWRYYAAMAAPFFIDTVISAIFASIHGLPELFLRNTIMSAVVLLLGMQGAARCLFRPIGMYLRTGENFAGIERSLTQLPLKSAVSAAVLYLPIQLVRIVVPLAAEHVLPGLVSPDLPRSTWLDAGITVLVEVVFIFVVVYFLISAYLEELCHFLFRRHGVNLGLFFGRFPIKIGVALFFCAVAPMALVAGEIFSYTGDRLIREVAIDLLASAFGLAVTLFWVSRALTRPLARLDAGMAHVAEGDLGRRLPVTSNEEIGQLTARFNDMVEGLRERRRIREAFGRYVSESVASALLHQSADGRLSGETREATLLFTDISGFTTLSEQLQPDTLIAVLNEYLEIVLEPIQRHGGVVNAFSGDGLFASFNLPLANEAHARCAVAAAIEIQRALEGRVFAGDVRLATRIGVNSGAVIGGTIGAGDRLSYTVLGDAVNTAARLQELNKAYGTRILVSEATRLLAGDGFGFAPIGDVAIRGRTGTLVVYRVDEEAPAMATPRA